MPTWGDFLGNFDWTGLIMFLFSAAAALICITLHELSHGFAAYLMGDRTAKQAGRLTLNPLRHLDILGLLMMVTVHVGWAKPVPINIQNFRRRGFGLAFTAMAGPLANFIIAFLALLGGRVLLFHGGDSQTVTYAVLALMYVAVLSLGLGLFNLIPIPPLDGSKIVVSLLPERVRYAILYRERYIAIVMVALVWLGVFDGPLNAARQWAMEGLCALSGFPFELVAYLFF